MKAKGLGVAALTALLLFGSTMDGMAKGALDCLPRSSVACSTPWWADLTVVVPTVINRVFADACLHHDFCYRFGDKTYNHSRLTCDNHFLSEAKKACKPQKWWKKALDIATGTLTSSSCKAAAKIYWEATRHFGASSFIPKSKGKYCEYESVDISMKDLGHVRDHRTN